MKTYRKVFGIIAASTVLMSAIASPASALEFKGGDKVIIPADQVINDDLYVSASEFTLDGVVKGDLVVMGGNITINGIVEGDLAAGGQSINLNGTVRDDARMGGAVTTIGSKAQIGGDVLYGGGSLETKEGSVINGTLATGAAQGLLAGKIGQDLRFGGSRLNLQGPVAGNAYLEVDAPSADSGPQPWMFSAFMPNMPAWPNVPAGLTFGEGAIVNGKLNYTSSEETKIPTSASRDVVFTQRAITTETQTATVAQPYTFVSWLLDLLRNYIALIAIGLLLIWLIPNFVRRSADEFTTQPWQSLAWGFMVAIVVPVGLLLVFAIAIAIAVGLGALTLSSLSGSLVITTLAVVFSAFVAFGLIVAYLTKVIVAYWLAHWLATKFIPTRTVHPMLLLVMGLLPVAILAAIPYIGGVLSMLMAFVALGAIWLFIQPHRHLNLPATTSTSPTQLTPSITAG